MDDDIRFYDDEVEKLWQIVLSRTRIEPVKVIALITPFDITFVKCKESE